MPDGTGQPFYPIIGAGYVYLVKGLANKLPPHLKYIVLQSPQVILDSIGQLAQDGLFAKVRPGHFHQHSIVLDLAEFCRPFFKNEFFLIQGLVFHHSLH